MGANATIVIDTNVLLNLATPVVGGRSNAPTGADPLMAVLMSYDVHVPASVLGEISETIGSDDLLSVAADAVVSASDHLRTHAVESDLDGPLEYGLDPGESHGIRLANEIDAEMFVTDEFNTTNYLLVSLALADRNTLFTTPHVLCALAEHGVITGEYVDSVLTHYVETKDWDREYVEQLRNNYLR